MNTHDGHLSLNDYLRILRQFQATAAVQLSDEKKLQVSAAVDIFELEVFLSIDRLSLQTYLMPKKLNCLKPS